MTATVTSGCAESWFYGGDVLVRGTPDTPDEVQAFAALTIISRADWRFLGTTVRAIAGAAGHMHVVAAISPTRGFGGILAAGGVEVHPHGSIVTIDASAADSGIDYDVIGIGSFDLGGYASMIHTPETAFVLKPAGAGNAFE